MPPAQPGYGAPPGQPGYGPTPGAPGYGQQPSYGQQQAGNVMFATNLNMFSCTFLANTCLQYVEYVCEALISLTKIPISVDIIVMIFEEIFLW